MFNQIFRFEIAYHARQPLVYVISLIFFLLSFGATVSDNISIGGVATNININSPYNVTVTLYSLSFLISLLAGVIYASGPVLRDFDLKVAELFLTTRVKKFDYLFGRLCGALVFCVLIYVAAALGVFIGEFMPWLDPERLGPVRLDAYWFATWVIALPNLLFMGSLAFLVATLTRSLMASYVVLILVLVVSSILTTFLVDPEDIKLLSMLDPFGLVAVEDITRYWTPFQRNELIVPLEGNLLINRLIVLVLVAGFLVLAYRLFPFSMDAGGSRRRRLPKIKNKIVLVLIAGFLVQADRLFPFFMDKGGFLIRWLPKFKKEKVDPLPKTSTPLLVSKSQFDFMAQLHQFYSLLKIEVHNIMIGKAFILIALIGMIQVVAGVWFGLSGIYGTDSYPTTSAILFIINGGFTIPLVVVLIFYSSELLVRERNVGVAEMVDSMPYPNWVAIAAKLIGLMLVIAFMLLAVMAAGLMVQLIKGYYEFELVHYFLGLFTFFQIPLWFLCVLAVFSQVITGHRFLGMFVMIVYLIVLLILPQQGFDQYLYLFSTPQIPYSSFTGYGPNLSAFLWFSLYWGLFCVLLLIAMHLLWQRGSEQSGRFKWEKIKSRLSPPVVFATVVCLIAFSSTGRYIYYNTNVLNPHITLLDVEKRQADYEKEYKKYEGMDFPDVEKFYTEVDLYPQEREAKITGRYTLRNNNDSALAQLHFSVLPNLTINQLDVPGSELIHEDDVHGYYIYQFEQPMQPGSVVEISFSIDWLTPGFVNQAATSRLLSNGTFFNNTEAFPLIGYQKDVELQDNNRRRKYDLPPVERMAKIDDESKWDIGLGTRTRANYEAIVSTSSGQIAVTPGYLQRQWTEAGRNYFHYKMDAPIWPFVSFLSADYEVTKSKWGEVDLEVYYKHGVNVERMLDASKKSFDYYTKNFSPYQYQQFRIFEFPAQRGTFAQSFPNTIPFSESIGFVADIRDPESIDYVFYVTAHELAHQWWGHQVVGANVQGGAVLTETLSQYSALMVMEKEYGAAHMQRFLKYELDSYLRSRGSEILQELPLMLVENQGYIHYRKGSVVLYALKDYLGEEKINQILREFIDEHGFQGPPYPTTRDLLAKIRAAAGPEFQTVITDMFENIILFDLRAEDSYFEQLSDGTYEVTVNTTAKKFEADEEGQETQIPLDVLLDIAVLGEEDEETKIPEVLFMEKIQLNEEQGTFVFNVASKPVSVGIDPFHKLIDRNPEDNVKKVEAKPE